MLDAYVRVVSCADADEFVEFDNLKCNKEKNPFVAFRNAAIV
jgi:hypothetical protein